jgi:sec-independent protein translocase protein TatA
MVPGSTELIVIGAIIVLLFGAKKLPELARSMGSAIGEFKKGQREAVVELEETEKKEALTKVQKLAQELGIDIEGKTEDQLLDEIKKKKTEE